MPPRQSSEKLRRKNPDGKSPGKKAGRPQAGWSIWDGIVRAIPIKALILVLLIGGCGIGLYKAIPGTGGRPYYKVTKFGDIPYGGGVGVFEEGIQISVFVPGSETIEIKLVTRRLIGELKTNKSREEKPTLMKNLTYSFSGRPDIQISWTRENGVTIVKYDGEEIPRKWFPW